MVAIEITSMATDAITSYLKDWIESIEWFGDHTATIGAILYWIIWIILRIALYFLMAFVGGSVILLLMSPLLTYASELVAEKTWSRHSSFFHRTFFARSSSSSLASNEKRSYSIWVDPGLHPHWIHSFCRIGFTSIDVCHWRLLLWL